MGKNTSEDSALAVADALAEQVLDLKSEIGHERAERKALADQVKALREKVTAVSNSVSVAPPPPVPLERPIVTLDDGSRIRFKAGSFKTGGKVYLAADVANDPDHLKAVIAKFPGLFEPA